MKSNHPKWAPTKADTSTLRLDVASGVQGRDTSVGAAEVAGFQFLPSDPSAEPISLVDGQTADRFVDGQTADRFVDGSLIEVAAAAVRRLQATADQTN